MKKQRIILGAALVGALTMAATVSADTGQLTGGQAYRVISTATGTTPATGELGCEVLASTITVGTSASVNGAFDCRAATATTPAAIGVGTCHLAGSAKTRTFACTDPMIQNGDNGCSATVATYEGTGPGFFGAVTTGGSVTGVPLNNTCTSANVETAVVAATTAGVTLAGQ